MKWDRAEWARSIGSIGVALLIASYVRYVRQGELQPLGKGLLIAAGVLILVALGLGFSSILRFFSKRSSQLGTNTLLLSLGILAILVIVNIVGYRHPKRFDLTTEKQFTLSDQTRQVVSGLQNDVNIVHFDQTSDMPLDDLMTEYKLLSPHLKFQNVNPKEKLEVAKEYGATRMGDVIVASGPRKEHLEPGPHGDFQEQDITSAILKVTREKLKTVCFVTGHGEKSLTASEAGGFSAVDDGLKKQSYLTKSINLVTDNGIPSDCDVAVVAGPAQPLLPQETAMLGKYLDAGGKGFFLLDPEMDPKLDDVDNAWNISVGNNIVIDASGLGRMMGAGPGIPLVLEYGASPITRGLQGGMTFFPLARTVSIAEKAKTVPETVELLKTSKQSYTVPNLKDVKYDPKTDTLGPLSLGVAASRKLEDKSARLVVIGDSDFATNQAIGQLRNGDLFYNTINWLAQDEDLISIRPKPKTNRRVTLTEAQWTGLKWFDFFFLPGLVIFWGAYIWWKRR